MNSNNFDMNKMRHLLAALIVLAVFAGCGKKVDVAFTTTNVTIDPEGATVEAALTSNGEWSVDTYPEWLTISPTSGKGDATLTLTAPANNGEEKRSGEVRVKTKDNSSTLTVTQEAREQSAITVSPTEFEVDADGGTFEVTVTANCDWTMDNTAEWILCEPTSGSGNGTVVLSISPIEGDANDREANIVFSGAENNLIPVHVTQHAPISVYLNVNPAIMAFEYTGGMQEATVHCYGNWTASCDSEWVTLSATSGDGDTEITVTVTENLVPFESRMANVSFLAETGLTASLVVKQEGAPDPHFLEVTPQVLNFDKDGGEAEIHISCDADWTVDMSCYWATLSATAGSNDGVITLIVEPNIINEQRTAHLIISSLGLTRRVNVTQAAGEIQSQVTISPDTLYVPYSGGLQHVSITANTDWGLMTSDPWITLLTSTGTGDAELDFAVDMNTSETERVGNVRIVHGLQTMGNVVVIQEGRPNIFETDITEIEAHPEGGEYTIQLTSTQSWTLNWDVEWMDCFPQSGTGSSTIVVNIRAMESTRPRTGHIKIVGSTEAQIIITVNQHN